MWHSPGELIRRKRDGAVGRDLMVAHVGELARAVSVPVSADLENAYGDGPEDVAITFREAAASGVVAASVEDSTGRGDAALRARLAVARYVRPWPRRASPFPS
jgi:2-methylisocitrate lyase-like PEP mutase family enzyme